MPSTSLRLFSVVQKRTIQLLTIFTLITLTACASAPERHPVPAELITQSSISGIPEARFWGNEWPTFSKERFATFTDADFQKRLPSIYDKPHNYLAISGGGPNGAFGAGLLIGWTKTGTRPEFSMVTGVSTGALSAPFAFLGSDYDEQLKDVYTNISTKDIIEERSLLDTVFNDSLADTSPLKVLITKYITADVIDAIAREYKKGRRLFIGTVNLDAGRSVIWNIGAIAISNEPNKIELLHDILRASASIPVAFPPVVIPVEINGNTYDEMHVDGGTGSQVFVYPAAVNWKKITAKLKVHGKPAVYVIRNSPLDADYQGVDRSIFPIAEEMAINGYPWKKAPPGYILDSED
jgi:predicted patatin/cPLA2 family phospholipase